AGVGAAAGLLGPRAVLAQGTPKRGGTLRVATVDKPVNMDPGYAQLYSSLQIYQNVYNKLAYVDEAGQFIPGLAKSWKQENDKTWLFDLVDNAVFHNGEPFTAQDVVFTFTRLLDAKNKLPMRIFFSPVEGVEAVGQYQARFHLAKPFGPLLAMLTQATEIVNEKALKEKDPKLVPIGTGPYRFVEWVKDDHVTLERWDKYFRPGRPYIDRIIFHAPADDTVRLTGLQTGRFNWIQTVPPQRIPELEKARDIKSSPGRPYFPFFFMLNASKPPLNDKRVRQAIAWALDRTEIVKLVYFGSHVVTADPDMFYNPLQHSTSAWNFTGFKSEEADRRLDAFRYTASPAARKKIYPELVRWFQEEGSLIIFSNEIQRYWTKPNVNGVVPLPSLELRFEDVWIA